MKPVLVLRHSAACQTKVTPMQVNDSPTLLQFDAPVQLEDNPPSARRKSFQEARTGLFRILILETPCSRECFLADYILGKMDQCCEIVDQGTTESLRRSR